MASKVPTDPNMTPEVRRFLESQAAALSNLTPASLGITGDMLTHNAAEFFAVADNLSDGVAATIRSNIAAAAKAQTFVFTGGMIIASNAGYNFDIVANIPFAATLVKFSAKVFVGSCTATLNINAVDVTGGVINVTTSRQSVSLTAANVMSVSNNLNLVISNFAGGATGFSYTVEYTMNLT